MKYQYFLLSLLLASGHTLAGDSDVKTAVGGGVGAAAGTAIGQTVGGKTGAVVGGAVGGGVGAAVTTQGEGKTGAIVGGAAGGAAGAAVGQAVGGKTGAVIGAGVGGAAGSAVGKNVTEGSSQPQAKPVARHSKVAHSGARMQRHHNKRHGHARGHDKQDHWKHGKGHHRHED